MATTDQLRELLAGGDDYIRTKNNVVRGLALKTDLNPHAPEFVVFGKSPRIAGRAELYLASGSTVPVYLKRATDSWSFAGMYRPLRIHRDRKSIDFYGAFRIKGSVAGILELERVDVDEPTLRGGAFANMQTRKEVEEKAIEYVMGNLRARGFDVEDCQSENLGYDLKATRSRETLLVEVKGTDLPVPRFFISQNECRCAEREKDWRLLVVTNARKSPRLYEYTANEMKKAFTFDALAWQATVKP